MPSDLLVGRAVTVRDAAEADLDAITAIWNHEVLWTDATTDTEPRNARTQREWFERHAASYPIVVAARGDQVLAVGPRGERRPHAFFPNVCSIRRSAAARSMPSRSTGASGSPSVS